MYVQLTTFQSPNQIRCTHTIHTPPPTTPPNPSRQSPNQPNLTPTKNRNRSGNLVEALDQLGDREAARQLLTAAIDELKAVAAEKELEEAAGGVVKPSEDDEVGWGGGG